MTRIYRFTLDNYTLCKRVSFGKDIFSSSFTVGGHKWAIVVFLNSKGSVSGEEEEDVYFGIGVALRSIGFRVPFRYKLRLIDQSGEGNHLTVDPFDDKPDMSPILITRFDKIGAPCLIRHDLLEESSFLKDDCLKIECTLDVLSPPETEIRIAGPECGDVGLFFLGMLETGEGADVIFNVGGVQFRAHKSMLSARSSVFESMFASHMDSPHQHEVVITGMESRVFKALLHFIYTDGLPQDERSLIDGYAFGPSVSSTFGAKLLAAADKYEVTRLKSICESHLWKSISLKRFAETLMTAERCNAYMLKNLCFRFAADHCYDLEELDTFTILRNKCPLLHGELVDYLSKEGVLIECKKKLTLFPELQVSIARNSVLSLNSSLISNGRKRRDMCANS